MPHRGARPSFTPTARPSSFFSELHDHTDVTGRRIDREAMRVEQYTAESSTKCMWLAILVLLAVMIVLLVLKGKKKN